MFRRKPIPTFDDVAPPEIKRVRHAIREAANRELAQAGSLAAKGDWSGADEAYLASVKLRSLSFSIPFDMNSNKVDLTKYPDLFTFDGTDAADPALFPRTPNAG